MTTKHEGVEGAEGVEMRGGGQARMATRHEGVEGG